MPIVQPNKKSLCTHKTFQSFQLSRATLWHQHGRIRPASSRSIINYNFRPSLSLCWMRPITSWAHLDTLPVELNARWLFFPFLLMAPLPKWMQMSFLLPAGHANEVVSPFLNGPSSPPLPFDDKPIWHLIRLCMSCRWIAGRQQQQPDCSFVGQSTRRPCGRRRPSIPKWIAVRGHVHSRPRIHARLSRLGQSPTSNQLAHIKRSSFLMTLTLIDLKLISQNWNFLLKIGNGGMWTAVVMDSSSSSGGGGGNNLMTTSANGSLTFHEFRPEHFRPDVHAATYRCSAFNSVGRILSTPVRIRAGLQKKNIFWISRQNLKLTKCTKFEILKKWCCRHSKWRWRIREWVVAERPFSVAPFPSPSAITSQSRRGSRTIDTTFSSRPVKVFFSQLIHPFLIGSRLT